MQQMFRTFFAIALCILAFPLHAYYGSDFFCYCDPCSCQNKWFLSSESLFFKVCEDGLPIGSVIKTFPTVDGITPAEARVKSFHPKWDTGFRLGAGYSNPCNCWGAEIFWTNFDTSTHRHIDSAPSFVSPGIFFQPAWGNGLFNSSSNFINETVAGWKLHLNIVDVQVARSFLINECIKLRPIIGVRACWLNQSFRMTNSSNEPITEIPFVLQELHMRCNYEGIGIKTGLETEWELGCGFHIYGSVDGALLYGRYDDKISNFIQPFASPTSVPFETSQKEKMCACRAVIDSSIGFCWKHDFCDNLFTCFIQLGWEHHLFIDQNPFTNSAERVTDLLQPVPQKSLQIQRGDLCLQGFVLTTKIEF